MTHIIRPKTLAMVLFHLLLYFSSSSSSCCSFFRSGNKCRRATNCSSCTLKSHTWKVLKGGVRQYEHMETCCRFFAQRKIEHVSCSRKAKLNGSAFPPSLLSWAHIKHILVLLRCPWKLTLIRHWVVGIGVVVAGSWHLSMIATFNWMSNR